ncbi:MAG: c-type cytochrome biogenesis protein CcsB [Nitrospirota bacterium]
MDSSTLFGISTMSYIIAMVIYIGYLAFRKEKVGVTASVVTYFGFIMQTLAIILRWIESYQMGIGHAPLSNLYESMVFFSWTLILFYIFLEYRYRNRSFGAFVTTVAALALAFITVTPGISKEISPLVPALQSNWLIAHVVLSFLGYAAFAVSYCSALMYLILTSEKKTEGSYIFWTICVGLTIILLIAFGIDFINFKILSPVPLQESIVKQHLLESTFRNPSLAIKILSLILAHAVAITIWAKGMRLKDILLRIAPSTEVLDEVTYKMITIGFPLLSLGIITGAIWADSAWGSYWQWDPKETWSLITWLVYAIYLHSRFRKGWRGKKIAVVSVIGFIAVIFTYLGVNLILSGLHSYA